MRNHKIQTLLFLLFMFSACVTKKKASIIVLGANNTWMEVYNGRNLVFRDSLKSSPITALSKSIQFPFNYRDSISVLVKGANGTIRKQAKIRRSKYIYIDKRGLNFILFGSNTIVGGY